MLSKTTCWWQEGWGTFNEGGCDGVVMSAMGRRFEYFDGVRWVTMGIQARGGTMGIEAAQELGVIP